MNSALRLDKALGRCKLTKRRSTQQELLLIITSLTHKNTDFALNTGTTSQKETVRTVTAHYFPPGGSDGHTPGGRRTPTVAKILGAVLSRNQERIYGLHRGAVHCYHNYRNANIAIVSIPVKRTRANLP